MPDNKKLEAAATMLEGLQVTIEELADYMAGHHTSSPTVAEFYQRGLTAISPKAREKYRGYIQVLRDGLPNVCWCRCQTCVSHWDNTVHGYTCPCVIGACICPPGDEAPTLTVIRDEAGVRTDVGLADRPNCDVRLAGLADLPIDAITKDLLTVQAEWVKRRGQKRWDRLNLARTEQDRRHYQHDGRNATEAYISSARAWFGVAVDADLLRKNPAKSMKKPDRRPLGARSLTVSQLEELWEAIWTSGSNDPELDMMLLWFHLETGTRRAGAIGLTVDRVSVTHSLATVIEKGDRPREQLMSPQLVEALMEFARQRGSTDGERLRPGAPVFYYRPTIGPDGRHIPHPLTKRRYNSLFERLRKQLPWADEVFLRPHDLRKTAASFIERAAGHAVARAYLGHKDSTVTDTYVEAHQSEIAAALVAYTGRSHPLAPQPDRGGHH